MRNLAHLLAELKDAMLTPWLCRPIGAPAMLAATLTEAVVILIGRSERRVGSLTDQRDVLASQLDDCQQRAAKVEAELDSGCPHWRNSLGPKGGCELLSDKVAHCGITVTYNGQPALARKLKGRVGEYVVTIPSNDVPGASSAADIEGREAAARARRLPIKLHRGAHFVTLEAMDKGGVLAIATSWLLGSPDLAWLHKDEKAETPS